MRYARLVGAALAATSLCVGTTALAQKKGRDNTAIAEKLVTAGVPIKEGDVVLVSAGVADAELLEELSLSIAKRGGDAILLFNPSSRIARRALLDVPAKYDSRAPEAGIRLATMADVAINVETDGAAPGSLTDLPQDRITRRGEAGRIVGDLFMARNVAQLSLGNGMYPGPNNAARYGMSQAEMAQVFWAAVAVDQSKLAATHKALMAALAGGKELEITHPNGTSLKVKIEGRKVLDSDGSITPEERAAGGASALVWLPAGEVYVTPVPGTAQGTIVDDRLVGGAQGKDVSGLTIKVSEGKIVSMSAKSPMDWLQKAYDAGAPGKEVLGVIDFGTNPELRGAKKLESYIAAGTLTYFFGSNVWAGGENNTSAAFVGHLPGCTVKVDGKVIVENGALKP
jgi:leucyl aminopeptidase (aminopeptidase T)